MNINFYDALQQMLGYYPETFDGKYLMLCICGTVVTLLLVCCFDLLLHSFGFFRKNR